MIITNKELDTARKIYEKQAHRNIDMLCTHERLEALNQIRKLVTDLKRNKF